MEYSVILILILLVVLIALFFMKSFSDEYILRSIVRLLLIIGLSNAFFGFDQLVEETSRFSNLTASFLFLGSVIAFIGSGYLVCCTLENKERF